MAEDDTIQDAWTGERSDPTRDQTALVVVYRDGIQVIPLREGVPVTLGRANPADVQVSSRRLSRVHVRLAWDGEQVQFEDMRSTNGTFVNGKRVERGVLGAQDELTVGSVVVSAHALGTLPGGLQGIERHERFQVNVAAEIDRARTFGRGLSVLVLRAFGGRGMLARWVPRVQDGLRPVDTIGLASPSSIEILLPEADLDEARRKALKIVAEREEGEPPLVVGVACYPQHGGEADALVNAAIDAVTAASLVDPVVVHNQSLDTASVDEEGQPVVRNPRMVEVWRTLDRVASANISVLILGETGVGKEILARGIHDRSARRVGPMRPINCGAIPATLIESVLFGHERGAFTGADRQRPGVFEEAKGGTVLLDEVGELSPSAQVALLRVLDHHQVMRVGGNEEIPVDVRVLAATHRDLEAMCRTGEFRWDLYYRLNTMTLTVPPLRERPDEIRPLVRRFIRDANRMNHRDIVGVTPQALRVLEDYNWPGNVRELRNVVERAVVIAQGNYVTADDLPAALRTASIDSEDLQEEDELLVDDHTDTGAQPPEAESLMEPLKEAVAALERVLITGALAACDGNQSRSADLLGLSRRTLVYKLKKYGIKQYAGAEPLRSRFDESGQLVGFAERVQAFEVERIKHALKRLEGDRAATARALGIQKRTLDKKLDQFDLSSGPP